MYIHVYRTHGRYFGISFVKQNYRHSRLEAFHKSIITGPLIAGVLSTRGIFDNNLLWYYFTRGRARAPSTSEGMGTTRKSYTARSRVDPPEDKRRSDEADKDRVSNDSDEAQVPLTISKRPELS